MLSTGLQKAFIRLYTIIKLSLFFWLFSFCGLLILGIGPSLLMISDLYHHNGWHYQLDSFKAAWQLFKQYFKVGNAYFYGWVGLLVLLSFNLWYSVRLRGLIFLILDFVIIFAIILVICVFNGLIVLAGAYSTSTINLLKLAFIQFFSNFFNVLKTVLGYVIILGFTYKFPGLILFGTVPAILIWTAFIGRPWYQTLKGQLA
ncbi:hypothetical protein [Lactobacillus alimentarius DSM 20249] [Lactiplantibacillus mudanjiangensis]|uniref:DUF624 domain-containing protein n=1 Tax=Lactiplantibacillus mudanjiangensis TaxID=1296538 RepID=UPI0010150899|nr:hypothetical protein [Lactobacillus alimentarius DSM 20249] [Lactiplantibacillus mudanjiangensis]